MTAKHISAALLICLSGCSYATPHITVRQAIVPPEYQYWLKQGQNQKRVNDYKQFLKQNSVQFPVADFQMLRSARDWRACHATEFDVPVRSVWKNSVPTLRLMQRLSSQGVISKIEVTSSYRSPFLNRCAGGARASAHLNNSAIDFRIGSKFSTVFDQIAIQKTKIKLCRFWKQYGRQYQMGLGVYPSGQIHVDTQGYRTWGYNHSSVTSLCR